MQGEQTDLQLSCSTYRTTSPLRVARALSGMWVMWLRARVTACRPGTLVSAGVGTSVRALSLSHRWRRDARPLKELLGTLEIWLASKRLENKRLCSELPGTKFREDCNLQN